MINHIIIEKEFLDLGLADGIMVTLLDSHVVNCSLSPGSSGLKLTLGACVPKI